MKLKLVVIQPTSLCNLNCKYCYVPNRKDKTIMTDEILHSIIAKVFQSKLIDEQGVEFLWHAGEPLLAGIDFYKKAMKFIQYYNESNIPVVNSIQTNGTLINDEWCDFFKEHQINVGFSLDGPELINGKYRINWTGKSAHSQIMKGLTVLNKNGIMPGILCVLTKDSLQNPDLLFNFILENDFHSVGFNIEEIENANVSSSINTGINKNLVSNEIKELYSAFISRFFDLWFPHREEIKIREFEDIIYIINKKLNSIDHVRTPDELRPLGIVTIQKNGDVTTYSPEFAGVVSSNYANFVVGNILIDDFESIILNNNFLKIQNDVNERLQLCRTTCSYFDICGGAYISNLHSETGSLIGTESTSCILHRKFLTDNLVLKLSQMSNNFQIQ